VKAAPTTATVAVMVQDDTIWLMVVFGKDLTRVELSPEIAVNQARGLLTAARMVLGSREAVDQLMEQTVATSAAEPVH